MDTAALHHSHTTDQLSSIHLLYSGRLFMIKAVNDESIHCWKDRLYVLTHGRLLLFSSNDPNELPLSSIPIHSCHGQFDASASSWILEISGKGLDSNDTVQERKWFLQTESESTCREWLDYIALAKQPFYPMQQERLSPLSLRQQPLIRTMEIQDPLLMQLVAEPLLLDLESCFQISGKEPSDFFYSATTAAATPVTPYLTSPAPSVSSNMSNYTQQQEYSKSAPQQQQQQQQHQRSGLEWLPSANSAYLHVSNWGSSMSSSSSQMSTRKDTKNGEFKSMSSKSLSSSPNQSNGAAEFGYRRKNSAPVSLDGTAGKKTTKKWRKLNSVTVDFDIL
ncbi:hypothetical protein HDU78_006358 [Chytriomyces hyalinus]|nr:hypothetical protein HDU78_006358 [Chytriomyces hyalinus]